MTSADNAASMALRTSRDQSGRDDDLTWLRDRFPYAKISRTDCGFTALVGMYRVEGPTAEGIGRSLTEHMTGGGLTGEPVAYR